MYLIKNKSEFTLKNKAFTALFIIAFFALATVLIAYIQHSEAAISTYNFNGVTSPSATHVARTFEVDVDFPTNGSSTIDTLTSDGTTTGIPDIRTGIAGYDLDSEASTGLYGTISFSDDLRWTTPDPGFLDTQAVWMQFDIAENPLTITRIDITLEGHQVGDPQVGRKAWLGIWVPGAVTPYWKTLEASFQEDIDYTFTGTLTSNLDDYIDGAGKLTIIFYNEDQSDPLAVDYVGVDITHTPAIAPPAIISAIANDPDNGDRDPDTGDTLTILFDKATNAPLATTKADIDGLINFPNPLGTDYSGVWSTTTFANDTLIITVTDGHAASLIIGDTVSILADGTNDLKDDTGASPASTSSKAITGNWGLRPDDDITYASDSNPNAHVYEVTLVNETHRNQGDLTYVGTLPIPTYAIARRPVDGYIISAENGTVNGRLAWLNPDDGTSGIIGTGLGATVNEFYRLTYSKTGVLYGMSNDNILYIVNDATGVATPICSPVTGLPINGAGDFAFDAYGNLYIVSASTVYSINIGACTATLIGVTGLSNISGATFTHNNNYHSSTFFPTNRKLGIVNTATGIGTILANFNPDLDIYDLGSVPLWADISIDKDDSGAEFAVGNNHSYTITVSNKTTAPDPAIGPITVTDTLPSGLTYVSGTGTEWTCNNVGQKVKCRHAGPIAVGASLPPITLTVAVDILAMPSVSNTVCADSTTFELGTGDNCDTENTIVGSPVLSATNVDDDADDVVLPGQTVTYTFTLSNTGTITATGVDLDELMDIDLENLSISSVTDCGASYIDNSVADPAQLDINDVEITVGVPCTVVFTADVKLGTPGGSTIPNTVDYSASNEATPAGAASADILITPIPIIGVTKTDNDADNIVNPGQTVTYTITLFNTGAVKATGIDLNDVMDTDMENLSVSSITNCGGAFTDNSVANPAQLDISGIEIGLGVPCVAVFTANVKAGTPGGSTIPNTVNYSASIEGAPGGSVSSDILTTPFPPAPIPVSPTPTPPSGGCTGNCGPPPAPAQKSCFIHDPNRPLTFNDLDPDDHTTPYITTLKDTKIKETGDYVFSGNDNHSTGKQQKKFQVGTWQFAPERNVRRLEVVKTSLVSNCIPIEDKIPVPEDDFRFKDIPVKPDPSNELMDFVARVFYTAYKNGINVADKNGYARPFEDADVADILTIDLQAANALTNKYKKIGGEWYEKYLQFAIDNDILAGVKESPDTKVKRKDFAKIILRVMKLNPEWKVYDYARQFNFPDYQEGDTEVDESSIRDLIQQTTEELEIDISDEELQELEKLGVDTSVLHESAEIKSCLTHKPNRPLRFTDVPDDHWAKSYIDVLRTTKLTVGGDYISSGYNNPSTGKDDTKYGDGLWKYRPNEYVSFFDLIKVALVSNCIPIEDEISIPENGFEFIQLPLDTDPADEFRYFVARIMYTAYKYGILKGEVHFFQPVNRFNALVILSRAARVSIPDTPKAIPPFSDIDYTAWYMPYLSYLYGKGVLNGYEDGSFRGYENLTRAEMAKLVLTFMSLNQSKSIQDYANFVSTYYNINLTK
jgi:uncharacterized repeat protein (TIGR01451 family)